ncbi:hypothetical protein ACLKA6_002069 [Drosophila palustris]
MQILGVISILVCLMKDEKHVACDTELKFAERCSHNAHFLEIDRSAQDLIVAAHNSVRQKWASGKGKVRVKACRMATVRWDDELAKLAAFNVIQCEMKHDQCRNTWTYKYSGQNLGRRALKGGSPLRASDFFQWVFNSWEDEGRDVTAGILAEYPEIRPNPEVGHMTAILQELNVAVGCAVSNYESTSGDTYLVACNYASANLPTLPIYRECKTAASECKSGTNPDYPALCSSDEQVNFNLD